MDKVGQIIRENREAKNITIAEVADELKISKDILLKIENDEIKKDADIVFYIGHLRSYSNFLELETSLIIKKFKLQVSYSIKNASEYISKPQIQTSNLNIYRIFSFSLIIIIFTSFYFVFIEDKKQNIEYALIPDLPESLVPIIEESSLDNRNNFNEGIKSDANIIDLNYSSAYASKDVDEINNVANYLQTKLAKFMILMMKPTQDVLKKSYSLLPVQDFSKSTTDDELFQKYGITDEEIVFIDSLVK